jgi:hypothetical protein
MAATGSSVGGRPTRAFASHAGEGYRPDRVGTRRSGAEPRRSRRPTMVSESLARMGRLLINGPSAPSWCHCWTSASSPELVSTITARSRVDVLFRRRLSTVMGERSGPVLSKSTPGGDAAARAKAALPSPTTSTAHPSDSSADRYMSPSAASGSATRTLCATRFRAVFRTEPTWVARAAVLRSDERRLRSFIAHFRAQPGPSAPHTGLPALDRRSAASRRCG